MSAPASVPAPASRAPAADDAVTAAVAAAAATAASGSKRPLDDGAHGQQHDREHERRVHPRLDGASADANDDGDAAADTSSHAPSRGSGRPSAPAATADRLHRHALECIFAFLSLRELAFSLRVSRDWLCAVGSMRRLSLLASEPTDTAALSVVAQSLMGRHVGELEDVELDAADLAVLASRMAHLRDLHCHLDAPPPGEPMSFPAALQALEIRLTGSDAADINGAIAAISRLPLLADLDVHLANLDAQLSFAPLAELPQLRRLTLTWPLNGAELSDAQADQLRALPHLLKLDIDMSTPLLQRLLRQPHDLQWQQMSLPSRLDDDVAAVLPQLPTLTVLNSHMSCSRFEWLRGLPSLTDATMSLSGRANTVDSVASLVAALEGCASIQMLTLHGCAHLTAAQLAALLPRLPRLRGLKLGDLSIDSLAFLAQPPLTSQLARLWLHSCRLLAPAELRHVHALRGLTELHVWNSFTPPLDSHDRSLLTPPSPVLPLLTEFAHTHRPGLR